MSTYDRRNYLLTIIATIAGVVSTYLAYRANEASWEIARASGDLDKPAVAAGIGRHVFAGTGAAKVVLGAPKLSDSSAVAIGSIPFTVEAVGGRSSEGVTITFQYNRMFKRGALEVMRPVTSGELGVNDSSPKGTAYFVFVPQEKVEQDGAVVFGPVSKHEVGVAQYPLVSWHLLFRRKSSG